LGVTTDGYSKPEKELGGTFDTLFSQAEGKQIIVTTISSNISRMFQIITSAQKLGRRIVILGRSIDQSITVARGLKYLPFADDIFVSSKDAPKYNQSDLVYIAAGCYGQTGSALGKLSRNEHPEVAVQEGAFVVFSADPNPPGVAEAVEKVQDSLISLGARVIYSEIQDNLHVSGHGTKGDLKLVAFLSKAKYYIPIGGTIKRMRAYSNMIGSLGVDQSCVFEQREGDTVIFEKGSAKKGENYPVKDIFVDGSNIGDVGASVIRDREKLSDDGIFVVIVPLSEKTGQFLGKVEIVTRGFVYVKESGSLLGKARQSVVDVLSSKEDVRKDWNKVREEIERKMNKLLFKETGRNPLIFVQSINL
jgi:ribonuclease J